MSTIESKCLLIAQRDERIAELEAAVLSLVEAIDGEMSADEIASKRASAIAVYERVPSSFSVQPKEALSPRGPSTAPAEVPRLILDERAAPEGYVGTMCSASGNRRLKALLEGSGSRLGAVVDEIVDAVSGSLPQVARSPGGRFSVWTLCRHSSPSQRARIAAGLARDIESVAVDRSGSATLQSACETMDGEADSVLCSAVARSVRALCTDPLGNHVVKAVIRRHQGTTEGPQREIYDAIRLGVSDISRTRMGCSVVIECVDASGAEWRDAVTRTIASLIRDFSIDRYANYVVQHLIRTYRDPALLAAIVGIAPELCFNKFGSNIVESAMRHVPGCISEMSSRVERSKSFARMVGDRYGNFVIQTMLDACDDDTYDRISGRVLAIAEKFGTNQYSEHLVCKLK